MCRRDTTDVLIRKFLDEYQVNLLSMPGRRVRCGSVYIKEGKRITAPGLLSEIVQPELALESPFLEDDLADLSGTWSGSVSLSVGIKLLSNFLNALGAAGLVDKLQASVKETSARNIAFCFKEVSRESLSATGLGTALVGHRLRSSHPWVKKGNRYFAVASVLRSASISIQGRDKQDAAAGLGAGVATIADVNARVQVDRDSDSDVTYRGRDPLAVAVELYELRWDTGLQELVFLTPRGPLRILGLQEDEPPDPVFVGDNEDAFIDAEEPEPGSR
ncbi:MAG TPA: hypothetical protein VF070_03365 [Streptosporangiaceae bacterium]